MTEPDPRWDDLMRQIHRALIFERVRNTFMVVLLVVIALLMVGMAFGWLE